MWSVALAMLVYTQSPVPLVPSGPTPPVTPIPLVVPQLDAPPASEVDVHAPMFGGSLNVGFPSGIGLNLVFQPWPWVRFYGGPAHNTLAFGGSGGASFGWFTGVFTPTLSLEGGAFASGDASGVAGNFGHLSALGASVAKSVDYSYGSAQVGIRLGWPTLGFFLRGGLSYLHANLRNFQSALRTSTGDASLVAQDPTLQAVVPAGEAGAELFFE